MGTEMLVEKLFVAVANLCQNLLQRQVALRQQPAGLPHTDFPDILRQAAPAAAFEHTA